MSKKPKELVPPMPVSIPLAQIKTDAQKDKLAKQFVSWLSSIETNADIPKNALLHITFSCDVQPIDDGRPQSVMAPSMIPKSVARGTTTISSSSDSAPGAPWLCQQCKTENPDKAPVCTLCNLPRPRSAPSQLSTILQKIVVDLPPGFPPKPDQVDKFDGDPRENQEAYKEFARKKARFSLWEDSIVAYRLRIGEGNRDAADKVVKELRKAFDLPETWDETRTSAPPSSQAIPSSQSASAIPSLSSSERNKDRTSVLNKRQSKTPSGTKTADRKSLTIKRGSGMAASDVIAIKLLEQFEALASPKTPASPPTTLSKIDDITGEDEIDDDVDIITADDIDDDAPAQTADDIAEKLLKQLLLEPEPSMADISPIISPRDFSDENILGSNTPTSLSPHRPSGSSPRSHGESPMKPPEFNIPRLSAKPDSRLSIARGMKSPRFDYGPLLDGNVTARPEELSATHLLVGKAAEKDERRASFLKSPREKSFRNLGPLLDVDEQERKAREGKLTETGAVSPRSDDDLFTFDLEPVDYKATAQRVLASLAESLIDDETEREKYEKVLETFEEIEHKIDDLKALAEPGQFSAPQVAKLGKEIRDALAVLPESLSKGIDEKPFVAATNVLLASLLKSIKSIYSSTGSTDQDKELLAKSVESYVSARDNTHQAIEQAGEEWRNREETRSAAHLIIEEIGMFEKAVAVLAKTKQYVTELHLQATAHQSSFNPTEVVRLAKVIKENLSTLPQFSQEATQEVEYSKVTQLLTATLLRLSKLKHAPGGSGSDSVSRANSKDEVESEADVEKKVGRIMVDLDNAGKNYEEFLKGNKTEERIEAEKLLEEEAKKDKKEKLKKMSLSKPIMTKSITITANSGSKPPSSKSKPTLPNMPEESKDGSESNRKKDSSRPKDSGRALPLTQTEFASQKFRSRSNSAPQTPREKNGTPVESQVAMLLNASEVSEELDVEIAEANFVDVSKRLLALEQFFGEFELSDSEDDNSNSDDIAKASNKSKKVSVLELFGPLSPLPERSIELDYIDDPITSPDADDVVDDGDTADGGGGRQWPPRRKNVAYQPKNEARLKRSSQELRNKAQLRHLSRMAKAVSQSPSNSPSTSSQSLPTSGSSGNISASPSSKNSTHVDGLPAGFPQPPYVNQELSKFASMSLGNPNATITRKNREQYKEYMRQKLLYEQWENGLILYKKRLEEGNKQACENIIKRLTEELAPATLSDSNPASAPTTPSGPSTPSTPSGPSTPTSSISSSQGSTNSSNSLTDSGKIAISLEPAADNVEKSDSKGSRGSKRKKPKEKEIKDKEKDNKRRSAKNQVKLLNNNNTSNSRSRSGSTSERDTQGAPDQKEKDKKKAGDKKASSGLVSLSREDKRATIDISVLQAGHGHRDTGSPSTSQDSAKGEASPNSSSSSSSSSNNHMVVTPDEKRANYKNARTKSTDALTSRFSRVFAKANET